MVNDGKALLYAANAAPTVVAGNVYWYMVKLNHKVIVTWPVVSDVEPSYILTLIDSTSFSAVDCWILNTNSNDEMRWRIVVML